MDLFLQTLLSGILIGGIYIMISIGFSLCFGVMHVIDFSVGEWIMLGGFIGVFMVGWLGADPLLLLPVVFVIFFIVGYLLQPAIQKAMSGKMAQNPALMGLVFTFGVHVFLQGMALTVWGFDRVSLSSSFVGGSVNLGFAAASSMRMLVFVIGISITITFLLLLAKTKIGLRVRATAQDREVASILGVDVKGISKLIYAVYAGVTGLAGVLIGSIFSIYAEMGMQYTTFAFFTVVLAGMGYLPGVLVGGLFLGVLQSMVGVYIGGRYIFLVVFLVLYLVLVITPQGILGKGWKAH